MPQYEQTDGKDPWSMVSKEIERRMAEEKKLCVTANLWFQGVTLQVLLHPKNLQKGNWRGCKSSWLVRKLLEEVGELLELHFDDHDVDDVTHLSVQEKERIVGKMADYVKECADVANFAMFLADRAQNAITNLQKAM